MKCPLAVCSAGTQVYKSSSMKRLYDHFSKVHSFTHPNPLFVFCCPVDECQFSSAVGNFRVYYHLKAEHPDYCSQITGQHYTMEKASAEPTPDHGNVAEVAEVSREGKVGFAKNKNQLRLGCACSLRNRNKSLRLYSSRKVTWRVLLT